MKKEILYKTDARSKLYAGVKKLNDAVSATLGPKGRNVVIEQSYGTPHITKDGVTVANAVVLEDANENLGAQIIKQAAAKTVEQAGDGTTTSTILAHSIVNQAMRHISNGVSPINIKRELEDAASQALSSIQELSQPIDNDWEKVEQVATISANNDINLGRHIRDAFEFAGPHGVVSVQESKSTSTYVDKVNGYRYDRGYVSPYFVTNPNKQTAELENVYILFYDKKIRSTQEIVPVLEKVVQAKGSLLVIADEIEGQALGLLVVNRLKAGLSIAATKCPAFGDRRLKLLEDMAVLTGGNVITEISGRSLQDVTLADLGRADKVIISKNETTILEAKGKTEEIDRRIAQIRDELELELSDYDRDKTKERLAKLVKGVAVLYVGAPTEVELKEKKDRLDDAINATEAALEEGIVPGAGAALVYASTKISDVDSVGYQILRNALLEIPATIANNAGFNGDVVVYHQLTKPTGWGLDVEANPSSPEPRFIELHSAGILDPTKVLRCAIQNAVSAASMLIMTDVVITEKLEDNQFAEIDTQSPF